MSKISTFIIALALGVAVGGFGAMQLAGGAILGTGIGTGLATGVCMVIDSAKSTGALNDEQIAAVMTHAVESFGKAVPEGTDVTALTSDCTKVLAAMRTAG